MENGHRVTMGQGFKSAILDAESVMGDSTLLTLSVPAGIAVRVKAGQFMEVLCTSTISLDRSDWRPFSVFRVAAQDGAAPGSKRDAVVRNFSCLVRLATAL